MSRVKRKIHDINLAKKLVGTILHSFEQVNLDSLDEWQGIMYGSPGSPYEDGMFMFTMKFHEAHPFGAPKITFTTKIYHPNIGLDGFVCRDIFLDHWSAPITLDKCFNSIDSLMRDVNSTEAVNNEAARLYNEDRKKFDETARLWTKKYAL